MFDNSDVYHAPALRFLEHKNVELVTSLPVVAEVMALLSFSLDTQLEFLQWLDKGLTIDTELHGDLGRIAEIMRKYADLPADFADASLVAVAERLGVISVASIDKDFAVYRTKDKKPFRNVF